MLPKTSANVKSYDGHTKRMYFWMEEIAYQKNVILFRIKSALILKKEFDSEPVYNIEFWKTKIKFCGDQVTDFYDKKIPKIDSNLTCLAVISLDSALKKDKNIIHKSF